MLEAYFHVIHMSTRLPFPKLVLPLRPSQYLWQLPTTVMSSTLLQATITAAQISSPGPAQIVVHTPANLSGDLGCDSGGGSKALTFGLYRHLSGPRL
jgi:hypothetical protein